jgi:aldose 1-epimerase
MKQLTRPLTGNQYTIVHGDYRAIICEQGAILRILKWKNHDLIAGFDADQPCPCMNGNLLIPYPNRIQNGTYTFEGKTYTLPIDEHERHNAIHGMGYRSFWELVALREDAVELRWRNSATLTGYPFHVEATALYQISDRGLSLTMTAYNNGTSDAPWAFGMHPWISNGKNLVGNDPITEQNGQCSLMVGARTHIVTDRNLIPTGTEPVDGTDFDFRQPQRVAGHVLDDAFCDPLRDANGHTFASLTRPDGITVTLDGDQSIHAWQVCNGTNFPTESHPSGIAIEPMTAYANAFRTGTNLITLAPNSSTSTTVRFFAEQQ